MTPQPAGRTQPELRLTLYSRAWCHLCDEMIEALNALRSTVAFELSVVDVDSAPGLEAKFGEDVPVLLHGPLEIARHRLDPEIFQAYVAGIR